MTSGALISSLLTLSFVAAPATICAQVKTGAEITVYGGTVTASGGSHVIGPRGTYEISTEIEDAGTSVGFFGGYNFNRIVGFEGGLITATNNHKATLIDRRPGIGGGATETNLLLFLYGDGIVHLPVPGRIAPYASAGMGVLGTTGPVTSPAFNYGAGLKVYVSTRVAIRVGANRHVSTVNGTVGQAVFTGNSNGFVDDRAGTAISFGSLSSAANNRGVFIDHVATVKE